MRQVILNIYDTFTEEGRPGTVAAEVFEQFIWVTTGVIVAKAHQRAKAVLRAVMYL